MSTKIRRQALDAANPKSEPRFSQMGTGISVGQFKAMIQKLNIPDDAKIIFALGQPDPGWALLESVSFNRSENKVSLW